MVEDAEEGAGTRVWEGCLCIEVSSSNRSAFLDEQAEQSETPLAGHRCRCG
jgi:hypothetical protein